MVDEEREREKKTRIYVFVRSSTTVYCFKPTSLTCKYISRAILSSIPPFSYIPLVLYSSPQNLITFLLRDSHQPCLHPLIHLPHRRRRGNTSDQSRRTSSGLACCPFFSASSCCRILRDILSRKIHPHSERRSITRAE